jgi:hypothetical protein
MAMRCFLFDMWDDLNTYVPTSDSRVLKSLNSLPNGGEPACISLMEGTRLCMVSAGREGFSGALSLFGIRTWQVKGHNERPEKPEGSFLWGTDLVSPN